MKLRCLKTIQHEDDIGFKENKVYDFVVDADGNIAHKVHGVAWVQFFGNWSELFTKDLGHEIH